MYERLLDKKTSRTPADFIAHIGTAAELFQNLDDFFINELNSEGTLTFDSHSQCWSTVYRRKKKYIGNVLAEKDAFTVVTRIPEDDLLKIYEDVSPYTKDCIDKSPCRHGGWIEYRVFSSVHLEDAKTILHCRASGKYGN